MPELTDIQRKQYNTYRAEGMSPERALSLATKDSDNQYNPALEAGVDNILFGKKSLTSALGKGVKDAAIGGFKRVYEDTTKFGAPFALVKSPLSIAAGLGEGVGDIVGGVLETADDLTGETVSEFAQPFVEKAVNSDVGQYLLKKGIELDQKGRGIPSDILDAANLVGLGALVKSGSATELRAAITKVTKEAIETGKFPPPPGGSSGGSLAEFFGMTAKKAITPGASEIRTSLGNIEKILAEKLDNTLVVDALKDIKTALQSGERATFVDDAVAKLDDLTKQGDAPLSVDEKATLEGYLKSIEDVLNDPVKSEGIEGFIQTGLNQIDKISGSGVSLIESLSDDVIDASLRTIDNIKKVPEAISTRAKEAIDRRIIRIATDDPAAAKTKILDLYKRGVVPGVKKKAKTITNIKAIDAAVQRTIPSLAKKYDVADLEDFANAIGAEKKGIFAEIEKGLKASGEEGRFVDTTPIIEQLDELLKSERASLSTPLRNAIERTKRELADINEDGSVVIPKKITPAGAQDVIADLNAQLQSYFRGSTSGTNADVIVDTVVLNNLRKLVDDIVDDLGEGSFKELKSRYADLKKMEDDVVHRAVFEAQKGSGITSDLTDIISVGDAVAGTMNPVFLAKGAAQFLTKEVLKSLSDKNELIRQMFLYAKTLKD